MNEWWAMAILIGGGLFAAGTVSIAWERAPAWRAASISEFRVDFGHTIRRMDHLQPALLLVSLGSTIGFALSSVGSARTLALLAAGGWIIVLVGSVAALVPIQRRLVAAGPDLAATEAAFLRTRWLRGHLVRTVVALTSFVVAVVAAVAA